VLAVLGGSQAVGLVLVTVVAIAGGAEISAGAVAPAAAGGLAGTIALGAFYRGLAIGTMSVVAPISATGAAVPVVVGLATGDRPSALQAAGIALAVIGVVMASREQHEGAEAAAAGRASVVLALLAAIGFGLFFIGMDAAADADIWAALLAARLVSTVAIGLFILATRAQLGANSADVPGLAAIGIFDVSANGLYAFASTHGLLSVVSVLGSLYPLTTVLLARAVLGERVRRVQEVGVLAVLAAVALLVAG
jgi:drug/metabolite transporter (DMT)-like permease